MMDAAGEIRKGESLNWNNLEEYLRKVLEKVDGEFSVKQFHGGHANLTYLISFGDQEFVLRRPPFGKIAPGAHSMKREYKVLSVLYKHFPQAPRAFHLCKDDNILGAEFVVMERRNGTVVRTHVEEDMLHHDGVHRRLSKAMMKMMSQLHTIDVEDAELSHLGRPEGFMKRQVDGWSQRWLLSQTEKNQDMESLSLLLNESIPKPQKVSVVHNDIKLDNCQFDPSDPDNVSAVFDWDMCTLGDPLVDLATSLSYWPDERLMKFKNMPVQLKGPFPDKQFLKDQYQEMTGFDLSFLPWYETFSYWRGAIVAQQLYKRYVNGNSTDERMKNFGSMAKILANLARKISVAI